MIHSFNLFARNNIIIFALFFTLSGTAQIPDSISFPTDSITTFKSFQSKIARLQVDSQKVSQKGLFKRVFKSGKFKSFWRDGYPNPKKATWLALALPGSGQIYNKQYWKLPIVYGSYTGIILLISHNRREYVRLRDNYIYALDDDDSTVVEDDLSYMDAATLRRNRDKFRKQSELSWIYLIGFHLLQTADAFVFAHLKSFDVNDDLTLHIDPAFEIDTQLQTNVGLRFTLRTNDKEADQPILFFE